MSEIAEEAGQCQTGTIQRGLQNFPAHAQRAVKKLQLQGAAIGFVKMGDGNLIYLSDDGFFHGAGIFSHLSRSVKLLLSTRGIPIRVPKIWDTLIYELQFTIYELKVSGLRRCWDKRKIVPMNGLYDTRSRRIRQNTLILST